MADASNLSPKVLSHLKDAFGDYVELIAEDGEAETFRVKAEFQLGDNVYAALQNDAMKDEDEVEFLRVIIGNDDEPQLESIDDDEEWEAVSEAYDDLQFAHDERP